MRFLFLFASVLFFDVAFSQVEDSSPNNFKVEFESWKPATKDLINSFLGEKAMPFLAPDISGKEQYLSNYAGKNVFIYFFNVDCGICKDQITALNLLQEENKGDFQLIGIGDESKSDLITFQKEEDIQFPVLYNGSLLGEAAYGIELGYPRLFAVNKEGKIVDVIPEEGFPESSKTYLFLKNLLDLTNSK